LALVDSLIRTRGDIGAGRLKLRSALDSLQLMTPAGPVHLDRNRQAVVGATLVRLDGGRPGTASFHPIRRISAVDETLGGLLSPSDSPSSARTACRRAKPPPWAR
jgi:hypothetical protein